MPGINLNETQQRVVADLADLVAKLKQWQNYKRSEVSKWSNEMAKKAHALHMELKADGTEPKHHRYMVQNRGVPPIDPTFYEHIHPVEDLLKFVANVHANDDPTDQTIGADFSFRVFCRRWGHEDEYQIRRTTEGWWVGASPHGTGDCDRLAQPFLFEKLEHDSINYPKDLPSYFEWLWNQAGEKGLSKKELQREIDRLARWVSICEQNTPGGVFTAYSGGVLTS